MIYIKFEGHNNYGKILFMPIKINKPSINLKDLPIMDWTVSEFTIFKIENLNRKTNILKGFLIDNEKTLELIKRDIKVTENKNLLPIVLSCEGLEIECYINLNAKNVYLFECSAISRLINNGNQNPNVLGIKPTDYLSKVKTDIEVSGVGGV